MYLLVHLVAPPEAGRATIPRLEFLRTAREMFLWAEAAKPRTCPPLMAHYLTIYLSKFE